MAPTELERLSTLEEKTKNSEQLLREIKMELRRLPRRISKKTEQQLALCRALQDSKHVLKPISKPDTEADYGWLKKLLVVGMTIGTLIGGAVYQVAKDSQSTRPQISQGGNP
jgi:hypothetical protein